MHLIPTIIFCTICTYESTRSTSQSTCKMEKWTQRTSEVKPLKSRHAEQTAGEDFHTRSHLFLLSE